VLCLPHKRLKVATKELDSENESVLPLIRGCLTIFNSHLLITSDFIAQSKPLRYSTSQPPLGRRRLWSECRPQTPAHISFSV